MYSKRLTCFYLPTSSNACPSAASIAQAKLSYHTIAVDCANSPTSHSLWSYFFLVSCRTGTYSSNISAVNSKHSHCLFAFHHCYFMAIHILMLFTYC